MSVTFVKTGKGTTNGKLFLGIDNKLIRSVLTMQYMQYMLVHNPLIIAETRELQ